MTKREKASDYYFFFLLMTDFSSFFPCLPNNCKSISSQGRKKKRKTQNIKNYKEKHRPKKCL